MNYFPILSRCFCFFFLFFFSNEGIHEFSIKGYLLFSDFIFSRFLFAFLSFLLSFLLGHWLVFGTSHTHSKSPRRNCQIRELRFVYKMKLSYSVHALSRIIFFCSSMPFDGCVRTFSLFVLQDGFYLYGR